MAVRLEEWTQSHWITPGVNLYANYGDYLELSNLLPRRDGKQLKQSIERLSQLDVEYVLPGHSTELGAIIKGKDAVSRNFAAVRLNYFPML